MSGSGQSATAMARNRQFYDRWRYAYDVFTRRFLPLTGPRATAVTALAIADGDHILELGCGTGANIPHVARAMGSHVGCRYTGVDIAEQALSRARGLIQRRGWRDMSLVVGDATAPPITGPVDAILSSFVITIFSDPASVVSRWFDLLDSGGRLVLVNTHPSEGPRSWFLNPWYNLFLVIANPIDPTAIFTNPPWELLRRRVRAAEAAIERHATTSTRREFYGGLVSVTVATA